MNAATALKIGVAAGAGVGLVRAIFGDSNDKVVKELQGFRADFQRSLISYGPIMSDETPEGKAKLNAHNLHTERCIRIENELMTPAERQEWLHSQSRWKISIAAWYRMTPAQRIATEKRITDARQLPVQPPVEKFALKDSKTLWVAMLLIMLLCAACVMLAWS